MSTPVELTPEAQIREMELQAAERHGVRIRVRSVVWMLVAVAGLWGSVQLAHLFTDWVHASFAIGCCDNISPLPPDPTQPAQPVTHRLGDELGPAQAPVDWQ